ncbi:MAG TPA: malto-oligosyltrehalose synthase [Acidimicrobiales bacterium]|nr:malto-oligosyltrehalose synthase [Acidimicrobiales bacterium]
MTSQQLGSTYRLQLNGVGLRKAIALVPYLADLGITTLYLSPLLEATPGSSHGYDVVDPTRLDPSLGTDDDLDELFSTLLSNGMQALLDVVPNHMAAHEANGWWWDVLAHGRASADAAIFDIDWSRCESRVVVPVLSRPLADVMADGDVLWLAQDNVVELAGCRFPVSSGGAAGFPSLRSLLEAQHYRPTYWRLGPMEGNYRRFFDIAGLIGVRVEDPDVFVRTHAHIRTMSRHRAVAGLRVDHADGLADPATYFERLRAYLQPAHEEGHEHDDRNPALTILAEKILASDETLDARWQVDGTTGYEFADHAFSLLVDPDGAAALRMFGAELRHASDGSFATLAQRAKREVLLASFAADLNRLTSLALRALDGTRPGHDLSHDDVRSAWIELTVHLDVYRTYLAEADTTAAPDRERIRRAAEAPIDHAGPRRPEVQRARTLLVQGLVEEASGGGAWLETARRWQQLSGAVMAKGVEDTATYRYAGLSARADVGGDPDKVITCDAVHRFMGARTGGLNATSTHDSKRNEDARCRLAVLSEVHAAWARLVGGWYRRQDAEGWRVPHPLEALRSYETLFVLWPQPHDESGPAPAGPVLLERAQAYLVKAAREAKLHTSWTEPDEQYEELLRTFVAQLGRDDRFRDEMSGFSQSVGPAVLCNTLALLVLKTCCPGVPDFYQGTESFEPALTDPDNRRPVDFDALASMLADLGDVGAPTAPPMLADGSLGRLKLSLTRALLHERRCSPELFARGTYNPLGVSTDHAVAWARQTERQRLVAIVPRLTYGLDPSGAVPLGAQAWGAHRAALPAGWDGLAHDVLTGRAVPCNGEQIELADALAVLPVAVLRLSSPQSARS